MRCRQKEAACLVYNDLPSWLRAEYQQAGRNHGQNTELRSTQAPELQDAGRAKRVCFVWKLDKQSSAAARKKHIWFVALHSRQQHRPTLHRYPSVSPVGAPCTLCTVVQHQKCRREIRIWTYRNNVNPSACKFVCIFFRMEVQSSKNRVKLLFWTLLSLLPQQSTIKPQYPI